MEQAEATQKEIVRVPLKAVAAYRLLILTDLSVSLSSALEFHETTTQTPAFQQ